MREGSKVHKKKSADDEQHALELCYSVQPKKVARKEKLAPRSGLQFKVGPGFGSTTSHIRFYLSSTGKAVTPQISARIDRGFDLLGREWVAYKRNYFTLIAAFTLGGETSEPPHRICQKEKFHYLTTHGNKQNIASFALHLTSSCHEDDTPSWLVQHTAKRDKGPQIHPPMYAAVPGQLPDHEVIKGMANIRNGPRIERHNKLFFLDLKEAENAPPGSILSTYPLGLIAKVAKYERIQFTTPIASRYTGIFNKHFLLRVNLHGVLEDGQSIVLASTHTPPLVVRGRSPSNYQLSKRIVNSTPDAEQEPGQKQKTGMARGGKTPVLKKVIQDVERPKVVPEILVPKLVARMAMGKMEVPMLTPMTRIPRIEVPREKGHGMEPSEVGLPEVSFFREGVPEDPLAHSRRPFASTFEPLMLNQQPPFGRTPPSDPSYVLQPHTGFSTRTVLWDFLTNGAHHNYGYEYAQSIFHQGSVLQFDPALMQLQVVENALRTNTVDDCLLGSDNRHELLASANGSAEGLLNSRFSDAFAAWSKPSSAKHTRYRSDKSTAKSSRSDFLDASFDELLLQSAEPSYLHMSRRLEQMQAEIRVDSAGSRNSNLFFFED